MFSLKKLFSKSAKTAEAPVATGPAEPAGPPKEKYVQQFSTEPYDFKTITVDELLQRREALWDLYNNSSDGFLVKNFLSEAEVDTILSNLEKVKSDEPGYTSVGFTYPIIFAEFSNRLKNETPEAKNAARLKYFERTSIFNSQFSEEFGVDVKARVEALYSATSGGREIKVAEASDNAGHYPFATFRYLVPDKGLMTVHCGNYFGNTFGEFYKDLTKTVAVKNQMSYFIMLQEPEEGGELTLFNFRWKDGQTKRDNMEDNEIIQPDGSKMYVEDDKNIIKDKIRPKKGDMILFQGGNIWHRVETVRGKTPRITFGGFIGVSLDRSKIYYWS